MEQNQHIVAARPFGVGIKTWRALCFMSCTRGREMCRLHESQSRAYEIPLSSENLRLKLFPQFDAPVCMIGSQDLECFFLSRRLFASVLSIAPKLDPTTLRLNQLCVKQVPLWRFARWVSILE